MSCLYSCLNLDFVPSIFCCPLWPSPLFPYKNLLSSLPFLFSSPSPSLCFPHNPSQCSHSSSACLIPSTWWVRALGVPCILQGWKDFFCCAWKCRIMGRCRGRCKITTNFVTQNFVLDAIPSNYSLQKADAPRFVFLAVKSPQDKHAKVSLCLVYLSLQLVSYWQSLQSLPHKNLV